MRRRTCLSNTKSPLGWRLQETKTCEESKSSQLSASVLRSWCTHTHKEQLVVSPNRRAELCSGAPSREQTSKARTYEQIRAHKSKHVSEWPGDQVWREETREGFGLFFAWVGKAWARNYEQVGEFLDTFFGSFGPFSGVQLSWSLLLAVTFLVCDELWVCELMRVGGQRLYAGRQTLQEVFSHCCEARLTPFLSKFGELSIWD